MTQKVFANIDDIRPGDRLGQDVMIGNTVLLRKGTVLKERAIGHLRKLNLSQVVCFQENSTATEPVAEKPIAKPTTTFTTIPTARRTGATTRWPRGGASCAAARGTIAPSGAARPSAFPSSRTTPRSTSASAW